MSVSSAAPGRDPTSTVATPGEPGAGPAAPGPRTPHLWQVDIIRLLTFAAVIAVHVLAFTEQPGNRAVAGAMMLLQFGREVFFALTGFVLVYSTLGRTFKTTSFWRKRMLYVAVPYVTWSSIYWAYGVTGPAHMAPSLTVFAQDLLYGSAMYHLYFLVVTLQMYLLFPLLYAFVRRTADRAVPVLVVVSALNIGWFAAIQYGPAPSGGVGGWIYGHASLLLPTYAMYILGGCYAAVHLERVTGFVTRQGTRLMLMAAAAGATALAVYTAQLPFMAPRVADGVLQPAMALSCLAAVIVLYVVGARWAAGSRRHQRTIEILSDASFGVYLAHPLVLQLLLDHAGFSYGDQRIPAALATVAGYVVAAAGATAIAVAARRTPLSLPLAGRPWRSQVKRQPAPSPRAVPTGVPVTADFGRVPAAIASPTVAGVQGGLEPC